ncbi:NADPH2:quinone reductase [Rhizobium sp. BK650]|nr:NADPH2:quinone reductase [Rhizobium sp. BK650]
MPDQTKTDQIVLLNAPGDVSQFSLQGQLPQSPGAGEIKIRHQAIGTNFLDIYHRKGLYALPSYPAVIGVEAAGVVEEVGGDVTGFSPGDRVAYGGPPAGAYSSSRIIAAERAIQLPDAVSAKVAASSLLKGMTAYMLLQKVCSVGDGSTVLIHAAAGGLGSILVRWAKSLGATVIGTVGSPEKASLAASYGADHLIVGRGADIVAEVKRLTGGNGVDVAYDGIGGDMLLKSIRAVRPFGTAITIGQAAGPIPRVPWKSFGRANRSRIRASWPGAPISTAIARRRGLPSPPWSGALSARSRPNTDWRMWRKRTKRWKRAGRRAVYCCCRDDESCACGNSRIISF